MNSIIKESINKVYHKLNQFKKNGYEKIQNFFYLNHYQSSDTEYDENIHLNHYHFSDTESDRNIHLNHYQSSDTESDENIHLNHYQSSDTESDKNIHLEYDYNTSEYDTDGDNENNYYYDECSNPFDTFNLANWDGNQQVGFRD